MLICQVHDLWKKERPHAEIFISICVGILIWMLAQFNKQEPCMESKLFVPVHAIRDRFLQTDISNSI